MTTVQRCPACSKTQLMLYAGGQLGMVKCKNCGYVGTLVIEEEIPVETPQYYRSGFDSWLAKFYDTAFAVAFFGQGKRLRRLLIEFLPHRVERVLDFATGTGDVALVIKRSFPKARVYGIDLSQTMLDIAARKARKQGLEVSWLKRNIEHTKFRANTFDAVTIGFGLHELPLDHRFTVLKEAYRVLRTNGRFILMEFHRPRNVLLNILFSLFLVVFEEPYAKTLLKRDLAGAFKKAGFHSVNKTYYRNNLVQLVVGTK